MTCVTIEKIIHFFIKLRFNKKLYSNGDDECSICMEFDKEIIFYPCKHYYCCKYCSKLLESCPICRSIIIFKIKHD